MSDKELMDALYRARTNPKPFLITYLIGIPVMVFCLTGFLIACVIGYVLRLKDAAYRFEMWIARVSSVYLLWEPTSNRQ